MKLTDVQRGVLDDLAVVPNAAIIVSGLCVPHIHTPFHGIWQHLTFALVDSFLECGLLELTETETLPLGFAKRTYRITIAGRKAIGR